MPDKLADLQGTKVEAAARIQGDFLKALAETVVETKRIEPISTKRCQVLAITTSLRDRSGERKHKVDHLNGPPGTARLHLD